MTLQSFDLKRPTRLSYNTSGILRHLYIVFIGHNKAVTDYGRWCCNLHIGLRMALSMLRFQERYILPLKMSIL